MKKLLSLIMYHSHNIHILHWKTTGPSFQTNHEYLDDLYTEMNDQIDLIAELMLQIGQTPLSYEKMIDYINEMDNVVRVNPANEYDERETFKLVIQIFNSIINEINNVYEIAETQNMPRALVSELETIQSWYMLRANYLLPNRLNIATEGGIFGILSKVVNNQ